MQKTANYNLNLYDATDDFLRANFNADNTLIDSALKSIADRRPYVTGTYTGSSATSQTITLGFRPKAVFIFSPKFEQDNGAYVAPGSRTAMLLDGNDIVYNTIVFATVTNTGFSVTSYIYNASYYSPALNCPSAKYFYIAFQ